MSTIPQQSTTVHSSQLHSSHSPAAVVTFTTIHPMTSAPLLKRRRCSRYSYARTGGEAEGGGALPRAGPMRVVTLGGGGGAGGQVLTSRRQLARAAGAPAIFSVWSAALARRPFGSIGRQNGGGDGTGGGQNGAGRLRRDGRGTREGEMRRADRAATARMTVAKRRTARKGQICEADLHTRCWKMSPDERH